MSVFSKTLTIKLSHLRAASLLYFGLPLAGFAIFNLQFYLLVLWVLALSFWLWPKKGKVKPVEEETLRIKSGPSLLLAVVFIILMLIAGYGGYTYQGFDWYKHFAMIEQVKALRVSWVEQNGEWYLLKYYTGFYWLPAIAGSLFGDGAVNPAFFLWSFFGLALVYLWLATLFRTKWLPWVFLALWLCGQWAWTLLATDGLLGLLGRELPLWYRSNYSLFGQVAFLKVPAFFDHVSPLQAFQNAPQNTISLLLVLIASLHAFRRARFHSLFLLAALAVFSSTWVLPMFGLLVFCFSLLNPTQLVKLPWRELPLTLLVAVPLVLYLFAQPRLTGVWLWASYIGADGHRLGLALVGLAVLPLFLPLFLGLKKYRLFRCGLLFAGVLFFLCGSYSIGLLTNDVFIRGIFVLAAFLVLMFFFAWQEGLLPRWLALIFVAGLLLSSLQNAQMLGRGLGLIESVERGYKPKPGLSWQQMDVSWQGVGNQYIASPDSPGLDLVLRLSHKPPVDK